MRTTSKWIITVSALLILSSLPLALIYSPVSPETSEFWLVMAPCLAGVFLLVSYLVLLTVKSGSTRPPSPQQLAELSMKQNLETMKWYEDMRFIQLKPWKDNK